jgi:hypothetical protein
MAITLDGTTGITTPGLTNTGTETLVNLTTSGNTTLGDATTDTLTVGVTGIVKDASGNVGIGTSSPTSKLVVSGGSLATSGIAFNVASVLTTGKAGTYDAGTLSAIHSYSDNASMEMSAGTSANYVSAISCTGTAATNYSATIRFTTYSAERMRIDSSGNVGIGTTSPGYRLDVPSADTSSGYAARFRSNATAAKARLQFTDSAASAQTGYIEAGDTPYLAFGIGAEYMRITNAGSVLAGATAQYGSEKFNVTQSAAGNAVVDFVASSAAYTNDVFQIRCATAAGTGFNLIGGFTSSTTLSFLVRGNGNTANTNNSFGAISDVKLKENIVDATPKLADLMQVKIRNYNLIADETKTKQIGVIAQELENIFPALIEEIEDKDDKGNILDTTTKSVKYSIFVPMLIKAMQEQQALITTLTARITVLETK